MVGQHLALDPLTLDTNSLRIEKRLTKLPKGVSFRTPYLIVEPELPKIRLKEQLVEATDERASSFEQ